MPRETRTEPTTGSRAEASPPRSTPTSSQTEDMAQQAKEKARHAAEHAQHKAEKVASEQKKVLADEVHGLASALNSAAEDLERQGRASTANYTRQAAEMAERLGRNLEERSLSDMLRGLQDIGRRQPALVASGAAMIGFVASRFLRSSDEEAYAGDDLDDYDFDEEYSLEESGDDISFDDYSAEVGVEAEPLGAAPPGYEAEPESSRGATTRAVPPDENVRQPPWDEGTGESYPEDPNP